MIQLQYRARHARAVERLLDAQRVNSVALARRAEAILVEGNRIDRMRGVDRRGRPLQRWRWRVGHYEGATGPTLAPFGESSRSITSFFAQATRGTGGWTLTAGFRGRGVEFLAYHAAGRSGSGRPIHGENGEVVGFRGVRGATTGIVRDIFGVSPATHRHLRDEFAAMARDTFTGRVRAAVGRAASFVRGLFS